MTPLDAMRHAAALGAKAPHIEKSLAVGCIIVDDKGHIIASGYSCEDGHPKSHAEKIALDKLPNGIDASKLKLYATVEPCGTRLSDNPTCTSLILKSGIKHVYYAMHEPHHFVQQNGLEQLRVHGIDVTHVCDEWIFKMVADANPHIAWE